MIDKDPRVNCPACNAEMKASLVPAHIDSDCPSAPCSTRQARASSSKPLAPVFVKRKRETLPDISGTTHDRPFISSVGPSKRPRRETVDATPLAERLRPADLEEFVGQSHIVGPNSAFGSLLKAGKLGSVVLWGPPGCGKTTLARLIAKYSGSVLKELSATSSGVADVKNVIEEAKGTKALTGRKTILFLDEIHRFNRVQQDIFLQYLEQGTIELLGATTENPSFKVTGALLSRCRVITLEALADPDILSILLKACDKRAQAIESEKEPNGGQTPSSSPRSSLPDNVLGTITRLAAGDARVALSLLDLALNVPDNGSVSDTKLLGMIRQAASVSYDRTGEAHYDTISALHKSVRSSDGNAAMFWLARMLTSGEDPLFIARRLVVMASEDIGLADSHALPLAVATLQACQFIGMPECRINLAHCVAYLSEAPKSTRSYEAYSLAAECAKEHPSLAVPLHLRNAPTDLMKSLGYGDGYHYNPGFRHPVHNECLPPEIKDEVFLQNAGVLEHKLWDEGLLSEWERTENQGESWEGRTTTKTDNSLG